jgi:hypothetical protein
MIVETCAAVYWCLRHLPLLDCNPLMYSDNVYAYFLNSQKQGRNS